MASPYLKKEMGEDDKKIVNKDTSKEKEQTTHKGPHLTQGSGTKFNQLTFNLEFSDLDKGTEVSNPGKKLARESIDYEKKKKANLEKLAKGREKFAKGTKETISKMQKKAKELSGSTQESFENKLDSKLMFIEHKNS